MRRREFVTLAGGAVAAWPLTAFGKDQRIAIAVPAFPVNEITETGRGPLWRGLLTNYVAWDMSRGRMLSLSDTRAKDEPRNIRTWLATS